MPNNSMNFGVDLLPVTDTTYYLGSNEKRWKIFADEINGLDFNEVNPHFSLMGPTNGAASLPTWRRPNMMDLEPTIHKEYASASQYGTNSDATCSFYMMSVRPDAWATPWRISFKIHSYCPAYPDRNSVTWCTLTGRTDGVCYYNYNENINSGHYYIAAHILKSAGYTAGYGHAIGINIRYGNNYTDSAYYRTFELDYYDSENCTVTVLDNAVLWANWEGASDTNYGGFSNYDAINRGLRETGDDNETGRLFAHSNYLTNGSTLRLPPYSIFGFDRTWKTQSISLYSADYTGSTTNINTARVYNTSGFDWKKGLLITNSGSNYGVNADVNISPAVHYYAADMRYNDNCVASSGAQNLGMQNRKPIFLRGVIKSDGLFYLAPITVTYNSKSYQRTWTQDIPTAVETDGTYQYVYWFLGFPYYNSSYANGLYQFNFLPWHPMYWYNDGKFEEYNPKITKADIGLGNVENTALSTWTGSNKITTVGTITAGTWNGTTIAVANGGTGATSASGARTNLGLGAAAVKGVTDNSSNADVTSSDTNLITGRTLYYQLAKKGYTTNTGTVTSVTLTSGAGITVSDSGTAITSSGSRTISITGMNTSSGSTSKCLTEKGTWASFTNNAGTVTSVQVAASDPLQSSTGTASSTTLSTTISFKNQSPNKVLAGPSSGSATAAPTFRSLVAADIPNLSWNKITSDKPTTLSGYGITDAATSGHTHSQYVLKTGDTMTGVLVANNFVSKYGVEFQNSSGTNVGGIFQDMTGANQFYMDEYTTSGVRECYLLPAPSATSTSFYDILTTKNAVTAAQGGTGITSYAVGDILYCGAANTLTKLTGNTSTTQKFLAMTGTGSAGAAPQWVDAPSGDTFLVTFSYRSGSYYSDKTPSEIEEAVSNNKYVIATNPIIDRGMLLASASSTYASFICVYEFQNTLYQNTATISSNKVVTFNSKVLMADTTAESLIIEVSNSDGQYTAYCSRMDNPTVSDFYSMLSGSDTAYSKYIRVLYIFNDENPVIPSGVSSPPEDAFYNSWYYCTNAGQYYEWYAEDEFWTMRTRLVFSRTEKTFEGTSKLYTITITSPPVYQGDLLSDAVVEYSESTIGGDYLSLSGGTMTGAITLNNGVAMYTGSDAGWSLNQYGNFTHRRTNANDYVGVIGGSGDFRVYYDSGNVTTTGYINASSGIYATNGTLVSRAATPQLHFQNASGQDLGGMYASSNRVYVRERPSAGSSYVTDIVFPAAKSNGNENVYVYTSRNFSLSGTTLTITVPS